MSNTTHYNFYPVESAEGKSKSDPILCVLTKEKDLVPCGVCFFFAFLSFFLSFFLSSVIFLVILSRKTKLNSYLFSLPCLF
ncbi:hypothetical protein RIF29_17328 [Crotalaria pallida]|uniref:Uncharacterized protein n=1 Tax=Crotalaria pallida TaxID=3830 RepID=A0AAN9FNU6_CROPI